MLCISTCSKLGYGGEGYYLLMPLKPQQSTWDVGLCLVGERKPPLQTGHDLSGPLPEEKAGVEIVKGNSGTIPEVRSQL